MTAFGLVGKGFLIAAAAMAVIAAALGIAGVDSVTAVLAGLAALFVIMGAIFSIVQYKVFGSPSTLRRISERGLPGVGVVENVGSTSGRVGANPIMRITMTIGVGQSVVRTVVPIQHLSKVIVGSQLPVLTDPDDPYAALIDWPRIAPG